MHKYMLPFNYETNKGQKMNKFTEIKEIILGEEFKRIMFRMSIIIVPAQFLIMLIMDIPLTFFSFITYSIFGGL